MRELAWAYLILFLSTWVIAWLIGEPGRAVGVGLLGITWIVGLGISLLIIRKDMHRERDNKNN